MKTWRWALMLFVVAAASVLLSMRLLARSPGKDIAEVYSGGELVFRIDLKNPEEFLEYTIPSDSGYIKIVADENGIKVAESNCRDGLCVRQGYLRSAPVVCLPNKLVIKWQNEGDMRYDAIAR